MFSLECHSVIHVSFHLVEGEVQFTAVHCLHSSKVVQLRANKGGSLSDCNQFQPSFAALDSN